MLIGIQVLTVLQSFCNLHAFTIDSRASLVSSNTTPSVVRMCLIADMYVVKVLDFFVVSFKKVA